MLRVGAVIQHTPGLELDTVPLVSVFNHSGIMGSCLLCLLQGTGCRGVVRARDQVRTLVPGECAHLSSKPLSQIRIDVGCAGVFEETPIVTGLS